MQTAALTSFGCVGKLYPKEMHFISFLLLYNSINLILDKALHVGWSEENFGISRNLSPFIKEKVKEFDSEGRLLEIQ